MRIKENTRSGRRIRKLKQLSGKPLCKAWKQSLSFEDLPGHRLGVLLMEVMSSGHISKTVSFLEVITNTC